MGLEETAELVEALEEALGKVASEGESRVEARRGMALGEDEPVPIGLGGVGGIDIPHDSEVEGDEDLGLRK
jgi:hypothetical protein